VLLEKPFYQIFILSPDVSELDPADYPFVYEAWEFGLHGAVAIKLRSTYRSSVDYILEFFFSLQK